MELPAILKLRISLKTLLLIVALIAVAVKIGLESHKWRRNRPKSAWHGFVEAERVLHERGDRGEAARLFRRVETYFRGSSLGREAGELADALTRMVREDQEWERLKLDADYRVTDIDYLVHNLRRVKRKPRDQPGFCNVVSPFMSYPPNEATELLDVGVRAWPRLVELLNDRRPTRSLGNRRYASADRTILRYQDVAYQILRQSLPDCLFTMPQFSYFSEQPHEVRLEITETLKNYVESIPSEDLPETDEIRRTIRDFDIQRSRLLVPSILYRN